MYAIEDFLSNIQSYDSTYDKEWLALAEQTRDEKGLHIFYLLSYMALASGEKESTELGLRKFSDGKDATIKVLAKRKDFRQPNHEDYHLL